MEGTSIHNMIKYEPHQFARLLRKRKELELEELLLVHVWVSLVSSMCSRFQVADKVSWLV